MRSPSAGISGFGRFGLGLFRAWFEDQDAVYTIRFINDDTLTIDAICSVIKTDPIVTDFHDLKITVDGGTLRIHRHLGGVVEVTVTTGPLEEAAWVDHTDIVFDCSSRASNLPKYEAVLSGETRVVLIGATTPAADATLIMGFNEASYDERLHRVISFGSCTVIPGIHTINMVRSAVGIKDAVVNVVHSVPKWQLDAGSWTTIRRKRCSLEEVAPMLLSGLSGADIKVNYTYVPYWGVSLMDFAFTLGHATSAPALIRFMTEHVHRWQLDQIIGFKRDDTGAAEHIASRKSISIVTSSVDVRSDRCHFFGYFNNEGSGIRLHELSTFIVGRWTRMAATSCESS